MKKFFKSMALSLVVAVFAICCLAGCGSKDEFKNGEAATATEVFEIASAETAVNSFTENYELYMIVKAGKKVAMEIDGQVVIGESESDAQVAMTIGMLGEVGYEEFGAYLKDGYAYIASPEGKVKVDIGTESPEYAQMIKEISGAMQEADIETELLNTLEAYAAFEAMGETIKVKKLTGEDGLVRFKFYTTQEAEGVTADIEMVVGYKDGHIVEYTVEFDAGKSGYTYLEIKALAADAEINYPADLDTAYTLVETGVK